MKDDAWLQLAELEEKYTKVWEFRPDLDIVAAGADRCVLLNGVPHNVQTVREYMAVLEKACAFVEKVNPAWASIDRQREGG